MVTNGDDLEMKIARRAHDEAVFATDITIHEAHAGLLVLKPAHRRVGTTQDESTVPVNSPYSRARAAMVSWMPVPDSPPINLPRAAATRAMRAEVSASRRLRPVMPLMSFNATATSPRTSRSCALVSDDISSFIHED